MLFAIYDALGDQAQDIVRRAADTMETLESGKKDFDKKNEIEELLTNEQFTRLFNLSKNIMDCKADDEEMADPDEEVIFDDDDTDEDEEEDEDEEDNEGDGVAAEGEIPAVQVRSREGYLLSQCIN